MSYNKATMKFEKQRIAGPLGNKIELTNQEFLTFRNSPPSENTGRSIYSQQFDYRSLQKYSPEDPLEPAKYNFKKSMRNIRSQDKYKQIHQEALSLVTDQNGQSTFSTEREKNEELKARIALISKSIRRAQKKSDTLDEQIAHLSQLVDQNNQEIQRSKSGVDQLSEIAEQNISHCNSMMSRIRGLEERAKELSQRCGILDRDIQSQIVTARAKDRDNPQVHMKLQQGMKQLQKMGEALNSKIALFEEEIYRTELRLEELAEIDQNVRSVGCV